MRHWMSGLVRVVQWPNLKVPHWAVGLARTLIFEVFLAFAITLSASESVTRLHTSHLSAPPGETFHDVFDFCFYQPSTLRPRRPKLRHYRVLYLDAHLSLPPLCPRHTRNNKHKRSQLADAQGQLRQQPRSLRSPRERSRRDTQTAPVLGMSTE